MDPLPHPLRTGGPAPIRRQVLSRIDVKPGATTPDEVLVQDVIVGGRTPAPFSGTMGAHSTAWTAHIDSVRRTIINRPMRKAARALIEWVREEGAKGGNPLAEIKGVPKPQTRLIESQRTAMLKTAEVLEATVASAGSAPEMHAATAELGSLINSFLTYLNYLPGATIAGGDHRGHGEGSSRGVLNQFEYVYGLHLRGSKDAERARAAVDGIRATDASSPIVGAFDRGFIGPEAEKLKANLLAALWGMFALDTPALFGKQTGAKVWSPMIRSFLKTVGRAYPSAWAFTAMDSSAAKEEGLDLAVAAHNKKAGVGQQVKVPASLWKGRASAVTAPGARGSEELAEVGPSDLASGGSGFLVTVMMNAALIGDVVMIGRTQSPFSGTMGAHSTAWIVHLQAVRAALRGKTIPAALDDLKRKSSDLVRDDRREMGPLMLPDHQYKLKVADAQLQAAASVNSAGQSHPADLEHLVGAYLTVVNLLPTSTVNIGSVPGGHAEGRANSILDDYEQMSKQERVDWLAEETTHGPLLTSSIWALFDHRVVEEIPYDRLAKVVRLDNMDLHGDSDEELINKKNTSRQNGKEAARLLDVRGDIKNNTQALMLRHFREAVEEAYPAALAVAGIDLAAVSRKGFDADTQDAFGSRAVDKSPPPPKKPPARARKLPAKVDEEAHAAAFAAEEAAKEERRRKKAANKARRDDVDPADRRPTKKRG